VATISNGSITNLRIVNRNRAPNAFVWFQLHFHISILEDDRIETMKRHLDKYAKDIPREWHNVVYCHVNEYKVEREKAVITMGFKHRSYSCRNPNRLLTFIRLVRIWLPSMRNRQREVVSHTGALKGGRVKVYRGDLHHGENLVKQLHDIKEPPRPGSVDSMFLSNLQCHNLKLRACFHPVANDAIKSSLSSN
jgi:hypothetical protein